MGPKNDVHYRQVCVIKRCALYRGVRYENSIAVSSVPEKSVRYKGCLLKEGSLYYCIDYQISILRSAPITLLAVMLSPNHF